VLHDEKGELANSALCREWPLNQNVNVDGDGGSTAQQFEIIHSSRPKVYDNATTVTNESYPGRHRRRHHLRRQQPAVCHQLDEQTLHQHVFTHQQTNTILSRYKQHTAQHNDMPLEAADTGTAT